MLNSCASGISVVNIDNGFGAAYAAHQITGCAKTIINVKNEGVSTIKSSTEKTSYTLIVFRA